VIVSVAGVVPTGVAAMCDDCSFVTLAR
jgi:hypothetical protein